MAPRRFGSVRHKAKPTATRAAPFRDDTGLVALRYEQTKQAEPPIPLPPPRNPRRINRSPSTLTSSTAPTSPIIVSPPSIPPPPEEHPLFRTQRPSRPSQSEAQKRDSGAPTSSSVTLREEHGEDSIDQKLLDAVSDPPSVYSNDSDVIERSDAPRTRTTIHHQVAQPPLTVSIPQYSGDTETAISSPTQQSPTSSPTRRVSLTRKLSISFGIGADGSKRLRKRMLSTDRAASQEEAPPEMEPGWGSPRSPKSPKSPKRPPQPTRPTRSSADRGRVQSPEPLSSPTTPAIGPSFAPITTHIPEDSLWDDLGAVSFSTRGSIMFGAKNNLFKSLLMSAPDDAHATASAAAASEPPEHATVPDAQPVPSIRVSSSRPSDPPSASSPAPQSDHANPTTPATITPCSANSLSPRRDSQARREFERAGGIEDWADLEGAEVDRYGFIVPKRPASRAGTAEQVSPQLPSSRRRNVLTKRPSTSYSSSLPGGFIRPPSRKVSARSLNTYTSELSTVSRRSTRSSIRSAANHLPHNRDRRWMDEAGEMLSLQAGLTGITDEDKMGKTAEAHKRKEAERSEKWRKMAVPWRNSPETEDYLIGEFRRLQAVSSPDDVQIDLDVPRTVNGHIMFRRRYRGGQRLLFRVLHAISLHFPGTGYVQGMASLAATLLCYFDEERAFVMMVRLWRYRGLERLYQPGFAGLMAALADFETRWLVGAGSDVAGKLKELLIDATAYGTRWYLTLFNLSIPFPAQLRVWDVFMLLGDCPLEASSSFSTMTTFTTITITATATTTAPAPPATLNPQQRQGEVNQEQEKEETPPRGLDILHATSAALIHALRDVLLDSDFENAMKALTAWIPVKDEDLLMKVARAEWRRHRSGKGGGGGGGTGGGRLWDWERGKERGKEGDKGGQGKGKEKEKSGGGMARLWERGRDGKDKDKEKEKEKEKEKAKEKDASQLSNQPANCPAKHASQKQRQSDKSLLGAKIKAE
ncbi:RabGAP/TBC [Parathielavia hyrcaniae]|uniref:RabGAP/TBC n=1 Tax=Parathielavia hyrcaniae TaxID=113614 RepID=A0AAN6T248_9PEZI|nr:RabGAP/TBC [Parathielavia hyrcaniae]